MPGLLEEHIAAVTGAGSGIGRAIALGFAREGAGVAALDVNGDTATQTAESIRAAGGNAEAFALDIADRAACATVAATVARRMGPRC
jgi:3-oxoacyl-[acyl-carrier protein] reductase